MKRLQQVIDVEHMQKEIRTYSDEEYSNIRKLIAFATVNGLDLLLLLIIEEYLSKLTIETLENISAMNSSYSFVSSMSCLNSAK